MSVLRWVLVSSWAALAACRPTQQAQPEPAEPPPTVALYGVRIQMFREGRLVAAGRAEKITYQRAGADVMASEALLRLPSRQTGSVVLVGAPSGAEIRAPLVEGNLVQQQAQAPAGAVIRTSTGLVGRTGSAFYDGRSRQARGDQVTTVRGPGYALRSEGFELDLAQEIFTFTGGVQSRLGAAK